jgi:iron complex outermembrane recepter protein
MRNPCMSKTPATKSATGIGAVSGLTGASCAAAAAGVLTGLVAGTVQAQQPAGLATLDEIVVTARKVEERLLDVPLTVTAFTSAAIEAAGVTGLKDLAISTPGLFTSSALGSRSSDRIAIRGISAVAGTTGFAGVFVDGVYVPSSFAQGIEVSNVERVEILKGPQSALFGRATLSGAINYVTRRPGDEWEGKASATIGEHSHFEFSGLMSGPVSDTLSVLVSGRSYGRESPYVNQLTGQKDVGGQSSRNASLGLRWQPNEAFEAYARVLYGKDDDEAAAVYHQNSLANNCLPQLVPMSTTVTFPTYYCGEVKADPNAIRTVTFNAAVAAPFRGTYADDGNAGLDRESMRAMLELTSSRGAFDFTSVSALGRDKVRDANDLTTRAAFAYGPSVLLPSITFDRDVKFRDYSQELRVAYDADGALSGLLGAYYYRNRRTVPGLSCRHAGRRCGHPHRGEPRRLRAGAVGADRAVLDRRRSALAERRDRAGQPLLDAADRARHRKHEHAA